MKNRESHDFSDTIISGPACILADYLKRIVQDLEKMPTDFVIVELHPGDPLGGLEDIGRPYTITPLFSWGRG